MKKEDLMNSFGMIKPDEAAKKRMLENILHRAGQHDGRKVDGRRARNVFYRVVPAFALTAVVAAGILIYAAKWGARELPQNNAPGTATDMMREDAPAMFIDQFQIDNRHYILLTDDLREDYGLPATVDESDIGEKITDIGSSPDKSLTGRGVYRYVPAGCEAVVAVRKDEGYQLYRFFTFESYNNNQDEDAIEYLKLYGINSAEDIARIRFIGHSERSKELGITDIRGEITDREGVTRFYEYFSALKNSSDKYFDKLFNFSSAPAGNNSIEIDTGISSGNSSFEIDIAERERMAAREPAQGVAVPPDAVGPGAAAKGQCGDSDIGFASDMPMQVAPASPAIPDYAEDMPLITNGTARIYPAPADTPVNANTPVSSDAPATAYAPVPADTSVSSDDSFTAYPTVPAKPSAARSSGGILMDTGDGMPGSVQGSPGSVGNALENAITIRIFNKNGIYFDAVYYRNIGFINRYEISEGFAAFISTML